MMTSITFVLKIVAKMNRQEICLFGELVPVSLRIRVLKFWFEAFITCKVSELFN